MDMLGIIVAISIIMWYVIDKFKPLWSEINYGKYITILVSAILGCLATFGFSLDLVTAFGFTEAVTIVGQIFTVLVFMCGSSAIAEIMERIQGKSTAEVKIESPVVLKDEEK